MGRLTEEQYNELAQFWREFMMLGPTEQQKRLDLTGLAMDFSVFDSQIVDSFLLKKCTNFAHA